MKYQKEQEELMKDFDKLMEDMDKSYEKLYDMRYSLHMAEYQLIEIESATKKKFNQMIIDLKSSKEESKKAEYKNKFGNEQLRKQSYDDLLETDPDYKSLKEKIVKLRLDISLLEDKDRLFTVRLKKYTARVHFIKSNNEAELLQLSNNPHTHEKTDGSIIENMD